VHRRLWFHLEDRAADEATDGAEDCSEEQCKENADEDDHQRARALHKARDLTEDLWVDLGAARLDLFDHLIPVPQPEDTVDDAAQHARDPAVDQAGNQPDGCAAARLEGGSCCSTVFRVEESRKKAATDDQCATGATRT